VTSVRRDVAPRVIVLPRPGAPTLLGTGLGFLLALVAFGAAGGLTVARTTWVEVMLIVLGGGAVAAALLAGDRRPGMEGRLHGGPALLALAALAALTALSIIWSLAPSDSWLEANRLLAYVAAFAGAVALARVVPTAWPGVLHGIGFACVVVCGWALLTKILPGALAEEEVYARLRAPLEYWNAVGLMAALGVPPLLWLGARRSGHAAGNALAWPGLFLLLVCLMLSYSRGALLALAAGLVLWFALVPLRLRGALVLGVAALAALPVVAWAFGADPLSAEEVPLPVRADAGRELGATLLLIASALLLAGLATTFALARTPPAPRARRAAGWTLAGGVAAAIAAGVVALAVAPGGVDGQVRSGWERLTKPDSATPANTPNRLTAASSVRARYWDEALQIHARSKAVGVGAGAYATVRTRVRSGTNAVRHAHGYAVQTLAELGWVGLGVSLLGLGLWGVAAVRATGLLPRHRGLPFDAERVGMLTLASVVVVFALHSLIDWTWYVPGTAVVGLAAAGWVAGRGPLRRRLAAAGAGVREPEAPRRPTRLAALGVLGVVLLCGVAVWAVVQPARSASALDDAEARADAGALAAAVDRAEEARERNPLAVEPLWQVAYLEDVRGRRDAAEEALQRAISLQPARAETWRRLGRYRLEVLDRPREALRPLQAAYYLDPRSPGSQSDLLQVRRALAG